MAEVIRDRKNKIEWQGERVEKRNVEESAVEYCERMFPRNAKDAFM